MLEREESDGWEEAICFVRGSSDPQESSFSAGLKLSDQELEWLCGEEKAVNTDCFSET